MFPGVALRIFAIRRAEENAETVRDKAHVVVSDPECIFRSVARQRLFRELLGPREGWVPIFCGTSAHKTGYRPPIIGEATGRTVASEFRRVTLHWSEAQLDPMNCGDVDFGISAEELLATATTWTKPYGELHQFVRDAPRISIDELRADIAERMPYLDEGQLDEEVHDSLGRRRAQKDGPRVSWRD
jgi:hypothetical protein